MEEHKEKKIHFSEHIRNCKLTNTLLLGHSEEQTE